MRTPHMCSFLPQVAVAAITALTSVIKNSTAQVRAAGSNASACCPMFHVRAAVHAAVGSAQLRCAAAQRVSSPMLAIVCRP